MWALSLPVHSSNRLNHNDFTSKYIVSCEDRITSDEPTTNEWLTITGSLKKTNQRDLNKVLKGILEKKKHVAIKVSDSATLQKEYTIAMILKDIPGFIRPICFFQCEDDFKEHPRKSLCKGPGTSMSILVLPYLTEGSMRIFDWNMKQTVLHSCLMQLFCSLMQAYESKGILHSDTHLDNVMLSKTTQTSVEYILGDHVITIPLYGYKIHIMDFELSFNEISTNRGRAIGQMYDDLLHAISDLRYQSINSISNDEPLMNALMNLKLRPISAYDAFMQLKSLIIDIKISPKIQRSFVYDPSVFG